MKEVNPIVALRTIVQRAGSQSKAAEWLHVSDAYVSDLLKGHRPFSARMLEKLGLARKVVKA